MTNIVNTKCNHQVCSDCYYKWAGDHNSCVFCRQKLYEGSRHEEYVKLGRDIRRRMGVVHELREETKFLGVHFQVPPMLGTPSHPLAKQPPPPGHVFYPSPPSGFSIFP